MKKKIIYVDMDDVLCDFSSSHAAALARNPGIKYPQSQVDFYRKLPPLNQAIESIQYLQRIPEFEVYILTAPSVLNPLCYLEKRLWVEDHLGMEMVDRLIISPNKGLSQGDYLIDDKAEGRGQDNFSGKLLQFGIDPFANWPAVLDYFELNYQLN